MIKMRSSSTTVNVNSIWGNGNPPLQRQQQAPRDSANANAPVLPDRAMNPLTPPPQTPASSSTSGTHPTTPTRQQQQQQQQIWQRDLLHYSPPDSSRLLPLASHHSHSSPPHPVSPSAQPAINSTYHTTGNHRSSYHQPRPLRISEEDVAAAEDQVSVLTDDNTWQPFPSSATDFPRVVVPGRPVAAQQQESQPLQRGTSDHTFDIPWDVNLLDPSSLSIVGAAGDDDEGDTIPNTTLHNYLVDHTKEERPVPHSRSRHEEASPAPRRRYSNNDNTHNTGAYHPDDNNNITQSQQQRQYEYYSGDDTTASAAEQYESVAASAGNSLRTFESRVTDPNNIKDYAGNDDHSSIIARPTVLSTTAPPPPRDSLVQPDTSVAPLEPAITQEADYSYFNVPADTDTRTTADMDAQLARMVAEGYPAGLARAMVNLKHSEVAYQIWIVDNSGSMTTYDGTRLVSAGSALQFVKCTRWEELQDCVSVHLKLSGAIGFPMTIRMLNDPGPMVGPPVFGIGSLCDDESNNSNTANSTENNSSSVQTDMHRCLGIMNLARPFGASPLTRHIQAIYHQVRAMESTLRSTGQKVAVVICTDGMPSDSTRQEFIAQLRRLDELPITIVIRMCTDEKEVVDFYNSLDYELETSIDVIDDYHAEAEEIAKHNPWLNYGRPLHRLREKGCRMKVLDLLDERPLSRQEQVDICCLIYGREKIMRAGVAPNPITNWSGFQKYLDELQASEELQWDPIHRKMKPWIDFRTTREKLRALKRHAKNKKSFMERILS